MPREHGTWMQRWNAPILGGLCVRGWFRARSASSRQSLLALRVQVAVVARARPARETRARVTHRRATRSELPTRPRWAHRRRRSMTSAAMQRPKRRTRPTQWTRAIPAAPQSGQHVRWAWIAAACPSVCSRATEARASVPVGTARSGEIPARVTRTAAAGSAGTPIAVVLAPAISGGASCRTSCAPTQSGADEFVFDKPSEDTRAGLAASGQAPRPPPSRTPARRPNGREARRGRRTRAHRCGRVEARGGEADRDVGGNAASRSRPRDAGQIEGRVHLAGGKHRAVTRVGRASLVWYLQVPSSQVSSLEGSVRGRAGLSQNIGGGSLHETQEGARGDVPLDRGYWAG